FKEKIGADLAAAGLGRAAVNYKLRDWLFSRQRFWGEPFPILHELGPDGKPTGLTRAVPVEQLPVNLPQLADYKPHGRPEPPLEKAPKDWLFVELDGKRYKRETNTMPQWAGSCWYYLRFLDPKNEKALVDPAVERAWMPIDLYVGGAEHAVLHLLYARFWHKVLFDRGHVCTSEPFQKLVNQGMILGQVEISGFQADDGKWVSAADVTFDNDDNPIHKSTRAALRAVHVADADAQKQGEGFVLRADPAVRLVSRAYKMSKSRGNVVNPDAVVRDYGADSLRLYEMFMGPLEATKPWSMEGVNGVRGFLDRAWRMIIDDRAETMRLHAAVQDTEPNAEQNRVLHKTIKAVTGDIESMSFNTAIARMMEFVNFFGKQEPRPKAALEKFVLLLSAFAPHIAEELWQALGHGKTLAYEPWPAADPELMRDETIEVPVQVNGKLRGKAVVPPDCPQNDLEAAARAAVPGYLEGKTVAKVIVVPGRLVNFVVK
ncbi:MAG: class I tRNA ligase family protein, partial [Planctomycetia bacterium]|nr:class I tRNA ligase family protein [Planctomycetia bacterium]